MHINIFDNINNMIKNNLIITLYLYNICGLGKGGQRRWFPSEITFSQSFKKGSLKKKGISLEIQIAHLPEIRKETREMAPEPTVGVTNLRVLRHKQPPPWILLPLSAQL